MRKAVDNNMNIVVHIHLDDGIDRGTWRNVMIFNPSGNYGGSTYYETVLKPTAEAVKMANYKGREVYFAMQVRRAYGYTRGSGSGTGRQVWAAAVAARLGSRPSSQAQWCCYSFVAGGAGQLH
jgi:hypothetical protein